MNHSKLICCDHTSNFQELPQRDSSVTTHQVALGFINHLRIRYGMERKPFHT